MSSEGLYLAAQSVVKDFRFQYTKRRMSQGIAILSAAITVFALVLSIFGASWLNQRNTERVVEELGKRFDARFDSVETRVEELGRRFDARFDSVEVRFDRIERQLEAIFKPALPK